MKVTIYYSESQLKHAVAFIAKHDPSLKGQHKLIEDTILTHMSEIALNPGQWKVSTESYMLVDEHFQEDLDNDTNTVSFTIYVNPALGKNDPLQNDIAEWDVESVEH